MVAQVLFSVLCSSVLAPVLRFSRFFGSSDFFVLCSYRVDDDQHPGGYTGSAGCPARSIGAAWLGRCEKRWARAAGALHRGDGAFAVAAPAGGRARQRPGLYAREGQAQAYYWTSSLATFPVRGGSGPTQVSLTLTSARWPERQPSQVALATGGGALASFPAPDQARTYHLLLPPAAATLPLRTTVAQPPDDPRWLGVQLIDITAERAAGRCARSG